MPRNSQVSCKSTVKKLNGYKVLRAVSPAVPNAIAAFLLSCAMKPGSCLTSILAGAKAIPCHTCEVHSFGEGDTAPVTHEVLRQAEKDPERRPIVHVGG